MAELFTTPTILGFSTVEMIQIAIVIFIAVTAIRTLQGMLQLSAIILAFFILINALNPGVLEEKFKEYAFKNKEIVYEYLLDKKLSDFIEKSETEKW